MTTTTQAEEARHSRWMARVDGCPECVGNCEVPQDVDAADGGFTASYRCVDCGARWTTSWMDEEDE